MKIEIQLFGILKSLAKTDRLGCELRGPDATVRDVIQTVASNLDLPRERFDWVAVAIGDEIVERTHRVQEGDVVMLLPPVSGGRR